MKHWPIRSDVMQAVKGKVKLECGSCDTFPPQFMDFAVGSLCSILAYLFNLVFIAYLFVYLYLNMRGNL